MIRSVAEQKVHLVLGTALLATCALGASWLIMNFSEHADADFASANPETRYEGEW